MHDDFERTFRRLSAARLRYEHLRAGGGALSARADALSQLHRLRAEIDVLRREVL